MKQLFLPFTALVFTVSGSLEALTVLPPATNSGSEIGKKIGEGFVQGMQKGTDMAIEQYLQQQTETQNQQEFSKSLQLLQSQKEEVEKEWIKDFANDVAKLNVVERIGKISPIADSSAFAKEHPAVQCVIAELLLYENAPPEISELLSKNLSKNQIKNAKSFALELLTEAANKKQYIQAKKLLATYYQDKKSYPQALFWLHSAAEDGASDAMRVLALYHGQGMGIPIDIAEYIKWLALAKAKGDKQSNQIMQIMMNTKQISALDEFKEGLKRANDWKQQHVSLFIHP